MRAMWAGEFRHRNHLQRCGQAMVVSSGPEGIVLSDGYVLPPPPNVGTPGSGVWRDQDTLIVSKGAELPDRCVKCNAPAPGPRLKKTFSWHHPAIYLLILVALLIYFVVAMVLRKKATVGLGLCSEHMAKHGKSVLISWLLIAFGVGAFLLPILGADNIFMLLGVLLLLAGAIYALVTVRIVSVVKIDDQFARLKGFNKDYLDELPRWTGG
jgi:hypothetical protein